MDATTIRQKFKALNPALDERSRRLWVATEAKVLGRGGIALVARATGVSRSTITRGIRELESGEVVETGRVRRSGGGRRRKEDGDPTLVADLGGMTECCG